MSRIKNFIFILDISYFEFINLNFLSKKRFSAYLIYYLKTIFVVKPLIYIEKYEKSVYLKIMILILIYINEALPPAASI